MTNIPDSTLYTPLDPGKHQVRFMHLQPGISNELIECTLEKVNLESKPRYEALSYEWGDKDMFKPEIKLNGNLVSIRNNLWWALHHLRHESKSRILWIDALCVNQENILERNHQVAQMKRIYSQASRVVVWIGREEHPKGKYLYQETLSAINFLEVLHSDSIENYPFLIRSDRTNPSSLAPTPHTSKWDAILKLCNRSYWQRLWIIQEIILASDLVIHCGGKVIPWDHFARFCIRVSKFTSWDGKLADMMANTNACKIAYYQMNHALYSRSFKCDKVSTPLVTLLNSFRGALCQDKRDKIYGLLSLCENCCRESVLVDYSTDLVAVCAKLLEHHIAHHCTDGEEVMIVADQILDSMGLTVSRREARHNTHRMGISLRYIKSSLLIPIVTRDLGSIIFIGSTKILPQNCVMIRTEQEATNSYGKIILYMLHNRSEYSHFNPKSDFQFPTASKTPMKTVLRSLQQVKPWSFHRMPAKKENGQSNASSRASTDYPINNENGHNLEKESISRFLERVSRECEPLFNELGIVTFLTSTGIAGCATKGVNLGDRVCGFNGGLAKSWGRVGFFPNDTKATRWTGKGLALPPEQYLSRFDPPVTVPRQHKMKMEIDVATLIYFSGYF